ncbi:hypothetical protein CesoFtcFv8_020212 [Champsocephalus esox]|uniref:Uncharacterized protein n=1 Tax=Champsocephalus esox TaxID=159716 RepID=A0AAN8GLZ2_9TELE|nr:hypothetical protein CesoFtcFv8_020212 [Champsocephalus esox]
MDMLMCARTREKNMLSYHPHMFASALGPFPRSTWIHAHVPRDNFDRVCEIIWKRAKEGQSSPEIQLDKTFKARDITQSHRAEEKQADDLGQSTRYEEETHQNRTAFILPCPYLLGRNQPHIAEPARVVNPEMKKEIQRNEEEANGKRNVTDYTGDQQWRMEHFFKKMCVPQCTSRRAKQSCVTEPPPLATNPVCSAAEDHTPQEEEEPPLPSKVPRETCESEDEKDTSSSSDSSSSDDDTSVDLPGVRSCGTDSNDGESKNENNDIGEDEKEIPRPVNESSSHSEKKSCSSSTEKDFPPLYTVKAGVLPCLTAPPASGKMHSQWDIPLLFYPHAIPAVTLAKEVTTYAQAPVQDKAEAPQADTKKMTPPEAPTQQEAYDLQADFPALQPRQKALGLLHDGNPKTKGEEGRGGHTHLQIQCQESGATHQRKKENAPHEVSSICAGDQKSVLDPQTFGSAGRCISPGPDCDELKANNQPLPRGADGVCVNARTWASAAKAGMKQAAAPQEKARPSILQQIVTINRAKAVHNFPNKVPPYRAAAPMCRGPRPRYPNRFAGRGYNPAHQVQI